MKKAHDAHGRNRPNSTTKNRARKASRRARTAMGEPPVSRVCLAGHVLRALRSLDLGPRGTPKAHRALSWAARAHPPSLLPGALKEKGPMILRSSARGRESPKSQARNRDFEEEVPKDFQLESRRTPARVVPTSLSDPQGARKTLKVRKKALA